MEYGTIERDMVIQASPATVFEVVTSPEHLQEWWPDEAVLPDLTPGATGELVFGDRASGEAHIPQVTVVEAVPPRLFSFRWTDEAEVAREGNSLLVTFELTPTDGGTHVRMTETGFRERGWEVAVLEEQYRQHVDGWAHFLPRLVDYAAGVEVRGFTATRIGTGQIGQCLRGWRVGPGEVTVCDRSSGHEYDPVMKKSQLIRE